jgi:hypothetical protein
MHKRPEFLSSILVKSKNTQAFKRAFSLLLVIVFITTTLSVPLELQANNGTRFTIIETGNFVTVTDRGTEVAIIGVFDSRILIFEADVPVNVPTIDNALRRHKPKYFNSVGNVHIMGFDNAQATMVAYNQLTTCAILGNIAPYVDFYGIIDVGEEVTIINALWQGSEHRAIYNGRLLGWTITCEPSAVPLGGWIYYADIVLGWLWGISSNIENLMDIFDFLLLIFNPFSSMGHWVTVNISGGSMTDRVYVDGTAVFWWQSGHSVRPDSGRVRLSAQQDPNSAYYFSHYNEYFSCPVVGFFAGTTRHSSSSATIHTSLYNTTVDAVFVRRPAMIHETPPTGIVGNNRGNEISRGTRLSAGDFLLSSNGAFMAYMQHDGNFTIYNAAGALWSTNTQYNRGHYFSFQEDGNLVVYSSSGRAVWSPNIHGRGAVRLIMQDDGNLVAYNSQNRAIWESVTWNRQNAGPIDIMSTVTNAASASPSGGGGVTTHTPPHEPVQAWIVTFSLDGGNIGGNTNNVVISNVSNGTSVTPPTNPTRSGFTFAGWSNSFSNVTSDRVITAQWAENPPATWTVVFNLDGGTRTEGGQLTQNIVQGGDATLPFITRTGYTFAGWLPNNGHLNISSDRTITAQWTEIPIETWTVTFNLNGGNIEGNTNSVIVSNAGNGASVTPPVNPTRNGFFFAGWNGSFNNVTGNRTIIAQWMELPPEMWTVTFNLNGGNISGNSSNVIISNVANGTNVTPLPNPTRNGFIFAGWSGDFNNVNSDRTITAQWIEDTRPTFQVRRFITTFDGAFAGNTTASPSVAAQGATISLSVTAYDGFVFSHWEAHPDSPTHVTFHDSTSPSTTFIMPNGDVSVVARFVRAGTVAGDVLNTDIGVFINSQEIMGYNINGWTYVVAEDLAAFGLSVVWDGVARTLSIARGASTMQPPTVSVNCQPVGSVAFPYLFTDIVAFINGQRVNSFNIDGRTVVLVDEIATAFGQVQWLATERELRITY